MIDFHSTIMGIYGIIFTVSVLAVSGVTSKCNLRPRRCWSSESNFPQIPPKESCYGQSVCKCSKTTADCSSNHGGLTFVPELRRSYQVLNFSYNNVVNISDINFFANVSREVRVIDLYNNGLVHIVSGVFARLTKLSTLLLGGSNPLGYRTMPALLSLPGLRNLSMSCVQLGPIPVDIFLDHNESKLVFLDLSWNHIRHLNMSVFQPLRNLRNVSLWQNQIYHLDTAYVPSWEILNLNTNRLYDFPSTCSPAGESLFPSLKVFSLEANMIQCIDDDVCLPNLTVLNLRFNHFVYFDNNTFSKTRFPSLRLLYLMQMENKIVKVEQFFINNSGVTAIDFNLNGVDLTGVMDVDAFGGCINAQHLGLEGSNFHDMTDENFHRLLRPMQDSLQSLFLPEARVTQISSNTFSQLRNLRELYLYKNDLSSIPDGAFDSLRHLKKLMLDNNQIATISENTFSRQLRLGYV